MKKIIVYLFVLVSIDSYSQNTIPTTTCTGTLRINDSLNVNRDITAFGDITSRGEVVSTDTLRAKEDVLASKDIKVEGSVYVNQDVSVEGKITAKGGLSFDGTTGITKTMIGNTQVLKFGNIAASPLPLSCAIAPQSLSSNQFGGLLQLYDVTSPTQNAVLNLQSFNNQCSIDASIGSQANTSGALLINYFCGNDVSICQGALGGTVSMGKKVQMQQSLKIGYNGLSAIIDPLTSIEVNQNDNNANGVKVNTYNTGVKAFSIERPDGKNTFVMYGSGDAYFGINRIQSNHAHANAPYQFDGKIGCKELVVVDPTKWADFVFEKNYKLLPLAEVEKYINENKHLPSVPSEKEVKENGINTAEMDAILLQKIEELTLYIMQQQKDIDALKKEIKK